MSKNCVIIGGGIVGLSCAYFLQKAGHQVTVIDQSSMDFGASYVNAGYLSPSHVIPLSAPGVMKKGLKWMFNSASPLYIKPRLDAEFLKWAWAFNKSCNPKHVARSIPAMRDMSLLSRDLYAEIKSAENFTFQLEEKGLLMLCNSQKALDAEAETAAVATKAGVEGVVLSASEIKARMPNAEMDIIGGTFYAADHHSTPTEFMPEMKQLLVAKGVTILKHEQVLDFKTEGISIKKVITNKGELQPDEVVLAAGSWTPLISKKLGVNLLLQAGKGYRVNVPRETGITIPCILAEAKAAITPMNGFTRFAGTMEIAGINHAIRPERVEAIAQAAHRYFPNVKLTAAEKAEAQCGLRPVTPDGMAYIGRSIKCNNLAFATGHAMMGWTLGPATGLLISQLIDGKKTALDLSPYHPDRRF